MAATEESATRQKTNTTSDIYDHPIGLIDTTAPPQPSGSDEETSSRISSNGQGGKGLSRKAPTSISVREGLARRKYRKWQEGRFSTDAEGSPAARERSQGPATVPEDGGDGPQKLDSAHWVETLDFAGTGSSDEHGRGRRGPRRKEEAPSKESKKHPHRKHPHPVYEIDILYENQRGWFVCSIPLYSHSSLLNFDPAPWVTKDFRDSPVNITNAQVPDPTWEWEWKSWYVDMSYDVDEEGWQYSFSFSPKFPWHGTHPWFHSFVRRRRWLRKRVRRHHGVLGPDVKPSSLSQAHILTSDYFTIHPKRDRSRSTDRGTNDRSSFRSVSTAGMAEPEINLEEITNIAALLFALKHATIDREKLSAVRAFVSQGGVELAYLKDNIPEIMSFFVFQNSKRQLLSYLKITGKEADQHLQGKHKKASKLEEVDEKARAEYLVAAIEAAEHQIDGLEYWSDRKHVLRISDDNADREGGRPGTADTSTYSKGSSQECKVDSMIIDEIKGIPSQAAIGIDPTEFIIARTLRSENPGESTNEKRPSQALTVGGNESQTNKVDENGGTEDNGSSDAKINGEARATAITEGDDEREEVYESAESDISSGEEEKKEEEGGAREEQPAQLPGDAIRIG